MPTISHASRNPGAETASEPPSAAKGAFNRSQGWLLYRRVYQPTRQLATRQLAHLRLGRAMRFGVFQAGLFLLFPPAPHSTIP